MVFLFAEESGRGRNERIFVVPSSGRVTIDGKLDDWDLSGQILIYIASQTRETMNARVALMRDDQALYISGVVRDTSPMINRHDPKVNSDLAWDGDAFQLRIALDPKLGFPLNISGYHDQLAHLLLWYYADRQEACLHLAYGIPPQARPGETMPRGVAPDKFQGAYLMSNDKQGYTFEYRIPWTTLGATNPPQADDLVGAAIQTHWGKPDGKSLTMGGVAMDLMSTPGVSYQNTICWGRAIFTPKGNLAKELTQEAMPAAAALPLTFTYDLIEDAEVTIALQDEQGRYMRQLIAQAPRKKGKVVEPWDGLDNLGKPLPVGNYTWKGLYHQPITTRYLLAVHNSGQPSYATPDDTGAWGADHGVPQTACAAGEHMVLAWDVAESGWGILCTDLLGKRQWGIKQGAVFLATDGERIFASGGGGFYDGRGVQQFSLKDGRPLNFGRDTPKVEPPAVPADTQADNTVTGLAYADGILYVSYARRDMICLYDPVQGTIRETWTVPAPERLLVHPDGRLLVISNGKVLAAAKAGSVPFLTEHLDMPVSIALDVAGQIYVACRAEKFSTISSGRQIKTDMRKI